MSAKQLLKKNNELELKDIIISNSSEIIMMLDEFSKIITVNNSIKDILNYDVNEVIEKPLRYLLYEQSFETSLKIKDLLLRRMKEVFQGYNTEVILPCNVKNSDDIKSICFKLIPIFQDNDLQYILAIGHQVESDFLTSNYLVKECAEYKIKNNLNLVNLLSYRLTRNLESRLSRGEIVSVQIGLQEAIINAIEHGNLEIDFNKKTQMRKMDSNYWNLVIEMCNKTQLKNRFVTIKYYLYEDYVKYVIIDEGKGFNWREFINKNVDGIMENYHGVGIKMIMEIFEVKYNDKGNQIELIKRFKKE